MVVFVMEPLPSKYEVLMSYISIAKFKKKGTCHIWKEYTNKKVEFGKLMLVSRKMAQNTIL
jgi:hypothetical protein